MNEAEAVKIFDLVVKEHLLPATLDKLVPMSFMGAAAVKFYQAKVKLMDQLGASDEQRKATLADGQDAGEMLLNIEDKIGELLSKVVVRGGNHEMGRHGTTKTLPEGIDKDQSSRAQSIHRNPEAVAAIIKEARENDDIPTKTAVLNKIRADKEKERADEYKRKVEDNRQNGLINTRAIENAEIALYMSKLREVVLILPSTVPKEGWNENSFAEAKAMVEIIFKRLGGFNK